MTIAVLGEALIDFINVENNTYRPHLGGSPFNVAIGLARQGINVSYLSALSDDGFGDQLYQALSAEGVKLPLQQRSKLPTSLAMVNLDDEGQASYRLYREGIADKDTSVEEILANLPTDLQVFHTGSLAITPSQVPKITTVFELLRDRGVLISIDINIRLGASIDTSSYLNGVRSLLKYADFVKASDEDIAAFNFSGSLDDGAMRLYSEMESGLFIFTGGESGACILDGSRKIEKPAYKVAQVADTVGAGDTFHAAFLAYLFREGELAKQANEFSSEVLKNALEFANAAAAINVEREGCNPPDWGEVQAFLANT